MLPPILSNLLDISIAVALRVDYEMSEQIQRHDRPTLNASLSKMWDTPCNLLDS